MGIHTIRYSCHEDWLELRRKGIGGSDAAAIAGLNEYASPYTIYLDKLGRLPETKANEAMRQGTDLEEYVAKRFSETTGKKVRRRNSIIKNDAYPFAHANVDRWIVGENAGLECKTTSSLNYGKFRDGEYPANYYIQCMHYMAVTGADKYYLAVLVFSKEFLVFEIERDEELIADLMEVEREFWERVKTQNPPAVDGSKATDDALNIMYDNALTGRVDLFGMDSKAAELMELKNRKKELEREIRELEQEFKERLGDLTEGATDRFKVSWNTQTRQTFQSKAFQKDHPEFDYSPYYKQSSYRTFRIKEL